MFFIPLLFNCILIENRQIWSDLSIEHTKGETNCCPFSLKKKCFSQFEELLLVLYFPIIWHNSITLLFKSFSISILCCLFVYSIIVLFMICNHFLAIYLNFFNPSVSITVSDILHVNRSICKYSKGTKT